MSAQFPDRDTVRTVMALAARAPSVHNAQPWRWRIGPSTLHLYADTDRHLPATDPDGRDLALSCGAALHHCVLALAAMGWQAKVHRCPNPAEPRHVAAIEVSPHSASDLDIRLAAAIPHRRTDRRHYSSWPVAAADIAVMGARAARAGVMLRCVEELPELARIVAEAVHRHASDPAYTTELAFWSGRHGFESGVPARNSPQPDPDAPFPARQFSGASLRQPPDGSADDAAVVLALGTREDTPLAWLMAGEATSLVLLSATAMGLASCPVTEPLEISRTRDAVQADVFGESGFPQMLVRVGWAPPAADPLPATPRRPLDEVVEWDFPVA